MIGATEAVGRFKGAFRSLDGAFLARISLCILTKTKKGTLEYYREGLQREK
jgi:hypothetical protein